MYFIGDGSSSEFSRKCDSRIIHFVGVNLPFLRFVLNYEAHYTIGFYHMSRIMKQIYRSELFMTLCGVNKLLNNFSKEFRLWAHNMSDNVGLIWIQRHIRDQQKRGYRMVYRTASYLNLSACSFLFATVTIPATIHSDEKTLSILEPLMADPRTSID